MRFFIVLTPFLLLSACGDSRTTDPGQRMIGGCAPFDACGGDIVGAWEQESSCLDFAPTVATLHPFAPIECDESFRADGNEREGPLTFLADGTIRDESTVTSHSRATISPSCLEALGLAPASGESCDALAADAVEASFTGGSCAPSGTSCECSFYYVNPPGLWDGEAYTASASTLTIGGRALEYCVQGSELVIYSDAFVARDSLHFRAR